MHETGKLMGPAPVAAQPDAVEMPALVTEAVASARK